MHQLILQSGNAVMPPPVLSASYDAVRPVAESADVKSIPVQRDDWVISLHLSACRRWLANEPPAFVEAERTVELLRRLALDTGTPSALLPAPVDTRWGQPVEARLAAFDSHLQELACELGKPQAAART